MQTSSSTQANASGFLEQLKRELPGLDGVALSDIAAKGERLISMRCDRASIYALCSALKEKFGFEHLSLISAVDKLNLFELVYQLTSYRNHCMAEIWVGIPKDDCKVSSVTPLWGGANWHEREAYDMMGIVFEGHPDPRRILLPQDYKYFPLRKDFRMEDE
jgi:NADH-quinone oxidoreductase subunit C